MSAAVIQLPNRARDVEQFADGEDWLLRTLLPMELLATAPSLNLASLADYWNEKRLGCGYLPGRSFVDPVNFARLRVIGRVHVIDVSDDDPMNFRFKLHGTTITEFRGHDFTGSRLGELANPMHGRGLATDYFTVKMTGLPRYQRIEASYDYSRRDYYRLILPISTTGRKVDTLVVGVSPETKDILG